MAEGGPPPLLLLLWGGVAAAAAAAPGEAAAAAAGRFFPLSSAPVMLALPLGKVGLGRVRFVFVSMYWRILEYRHANEGQEGSMNEGISGVREE